ncbi:hypothetical protein Golax_023392, partial [Gossypium laxum]|nr:hypothetical protein [Gossypium laxum]
MKAKKITTLETANFVRNYLIELDGLKILLPVKSRVEERWKPLESPFVKINFDDAFKKDEHRSCSGIVGRDSKGKVLGSRVVQNVWVSSVFAAEAIACAQGLQMWLDLGVMAVEVESDALSVIKKKKLQKDEDDKLEISVIIRDCLWLSKAFQICKFLHGKRTKNEVANLLATEGLRNGEQKDEKWRSTWLRRGDGGKRSSEEWVNLLMGVVLFSVLLKLGEEDLK